VNNRKEIEAAMADTQNSEVVMRPKMRDRRGPQMRERQDAPDMDSESLRFFREETAGLSNRLMLPSVESMRAGTINNPISLIRRFLVAMKSAGLPKERGQRIAVWVQRTVDSLWPMEQTPLEVLEQRAMDLEHASNRAEKCHDLKQDAASLQVRLSTESAEIASKQLVLAKLQRRLEDIRGCQ
jgi:hypothetical protein